MKKIDILQNKWITIILIVTCLALIISFSLFAVKTSAEAVSVQEELIATNEELMDAQAALETITIDLEQAKTRAAKAETELSESNMALMESEIELQEMTKNIAEIEEKLFDSEQVYGVIISDRDVDLIAKTVWGEARGLSKFEQSMVVWCILNRVDAGYGTIKQVVTAEGQFHGYKSHFPVKKDIKTLVKDVIARWQLEKVCHGDVGRTLPADYLYFYGDGKHNHYRTKYRGGETWDWGNAWNPYE